MVRTLTLPDLARRVGCERWPERWNEFFDQVMEDFNQNGCVYTKGQYYENLNQKYGILSKDLPLYKQAAEEVGKSEDLSRFLVLLCRALQDREYHQADLKSFSAPKRADGAPDLAYDMLTALAIASEADMCHALATQRKLPAEFVRQLMHMPETGVDSYRKQHDGRPGYALLEWYQLAIDGKLFRVGRLEIELFARFNGRACVFENEAGQQVALAHEIRLHRSGNTLKSAHFEDEEGSWTAAVTETDAYWEGNPVNERGLVENRVLRLDKARWKLILSRGDPVIGLHIPADGPLTPEAVDDTIDAARAFAKTYFPDYSYKAFACYSWLMDPQLIDLLGEDANISKFCRRFQKVTLWSKGTGVFNFVFQKPDMNFALAALPETTRLERALKRHYLSGKAIYEITGYFF